LYVRTYLYCFCIGIDFRTHSDFKAFENLDDDVRQEKYQVPLDLLRFIVQSGCAVIRCVQTCGHEVEGQSLCSCRALLHLIPASLLITAPTPGTGLTLGPKGTWFQLRGVLGLLLFSSPKCWPSWQHPQTVRHPFPLIHLPFFLTHPITPPSSPQSLLSLSLIPRSSPLTRPLTLPPHPLPLTPHHSVPHL